MRRLRRRVAPARRPPVDRPSPAPPQAAPPELSPVSAPPVLGNQAVQRSVQNGHLPADLVLAHRQALGNQPQHADGSGQPPRRIGVRAADAGRGRNLRQDQL